MTIAEQRLKTLVLGPEDFRLREPLNVFGLPGLVKLAGSDTGNAVAVLYLTSPKMTGPALHRHAREDEWFYILSGEVTVEVDGQRSIAGAGASAFAPRGTAHTFQNFHDEPARLLIMFTPGGLDQGFVDLTELTRSTTEVDATRAEQLLNSYGVEILGPPLS